MTVASSIYPKWEASWSGEFLPFRSSLSYFSQLELIIRSIDQDDGGAAGGTHFTALQKCLAGK